MEHTHYFRITSDAVDFCEQFSNAYHYGGGEVVITELDQDGLDYLQGCEDFGPFPYDNSDDR